MRQYKTAQTAALKLTDMVKYLAISSFFATTSVAVYLLTAS